MRHFAVIGAGPSGCYVVDGLLRLAPDARVDVLERLPTPFGLVRYGVAPDHQSTKAVSRVLERALNHDSARFFGNVEVGRDVRLEELLSLYDAVVLATGASVDRRLGITGEDLAGVYGSGEFVRWYNSHPEPTSVQLAGIRSAVIVGAGNVALDVARILAKSPAEFAGSDLPPEVEAALKAQPLERVTLVARGGAAQARYSTLELEELGALERVRTEVDAPGGLEGDGPVLEILRRFAGEATRPAPVTLQFRFGLRPEAILGADRAEAVRCRDTTGALVDIPAQLVVTCIGYEARACCTQAPSGGVFTNENGRIRDRLYSTGWCKRGPSGTIPANRVEAQAVARRVVEEVSGGGRSGGAGLSALLAERGVQIVDREGWRRIDQDEVSRATEGRIRRKHSDVHGMLAAARET